MRPHLVDGDLVDNLTPPYLYSRRDDIYPLKYFHPLAVVFKFTQFVWAFYPVTCGQKV